MRTLRWSVLRWGEPALLALGAVAYSYGRRHNVQFWDGAVANWLATLLGIITGVPVAFFLERRRVESEARNRQAEVRRIRSDVLKLLSHELADAVQRLSIRLADAASVPLDPMKMSAWNALRDSGNLVHISEPELLGTIADAYRLLVVITDKEAHFIQIAYGVNVMFPDGENAGQKLNRDLSQFYGPAIHQVQLALTLVNEAWKNCDPSHASIV
jgi:signal transduction histidine kinase